MNKSSQAQAETKVKAMFKAGKFDSEIADAIGYSVEGVRAIRRRLHLRYPNGRHIVSTTSREKPSTVRDTREVSEETLHEKGELASRDARIRVLLKENNLLIKRGNLWEQVKGLLEDSVRSLASVKYPIAVPESKESSPETFCVQLTDWHYAEVVSYKETNGFNQYNRAIAVRRLEAYSEKIRSFVKNQLKGLNFHKCVVFITGDMVSGLIHDELIRTNETGIISQSVEAAHYVAQFLREIASIFPEVQVVCVTGNHGREKQKREVKGNKESFDRLVYLIVKMKLDDQKNVTFDIPEAPYAITKVEGRWILSQHGNHGIGPSSFGIAAYGILRMAAKLAAMFLTKNIVVSTIIMGHKHHEWTIPWGAGRLVLLGPSIKGADEYSMNDLGVGDEAGQLIFGYTHKVRVTWRWVINLQDVGKKPKRFTLYSE